MIIQMDLNDVLNELRGIRDDLQTDLEESKIKHLDNVIANFKEVNAKETSMKTRKTSWGFASKIFCMIASIYIAVVPETIWSAIFWSIYTVGAVLGIIHLRKLKDKDTMQMYIIWFVLDFYAIIRLIIGLSW